MEFFTAWQAECSVQRKVLLEAWDSSPDYTAAVLRNYPAGSVVAEVGRRLNLATYCEYYGLDAIFFADRNERNDRNDRVHCSPLGQTWVHTIQVAFEHENHFASGLFQEVSHLLITRADLRVLVTYPDDGEAAELDRLSQIIKATKLDDPAFLLITGKRDDKQDGIWTNIVWTGRVHTKEGWSIPI